MRNSFAFPAKEFPEFVFHGFGAGDEFAPGVRMFSSLSKLSADFEAQPSVSPEPRACTLVPGSATPTRHLPANLHPHPSTISLPQHEIIISPWLSSWCCQRQGLFPPLAAGGGDTNPMDESLLVPSRVSSWLREVTQPGQEGLCSWCHLTNSSAGRQLKPGNFPGTEPCWDLQYKQELPPMSEELGVLVRDF